jgi:hypothetical protein
MARYTGAGGSRIFAYYVEGLIFPADGYELDPPFVVGVLLAVYYTCWKPKYNCSEHNVENFRIDVRSITPCHNLLINPRGFQGGESFVNSIAGSLCVNMLVEAGLGDFN